MSKDNSYHNKPYQFFMRYDDWQELLDNGNIGPWYIVSVEKPIAFFWNDDRLRSCALNGFKIAQWWKKNAEKTDKIFYYKTRGDNYHLIFDDKDLALKFSDWYSKLSPEVKEDDSRDLWSGRNSFLKTVEINGEISLRGKLDVELLMEYYNDDILTEEIFDIYCWLEENAEKVYYWGDHFYFTQASDAIAFKLRWL